MFCKFGLAHRTDGPTTYCVPGIWRCRLVYTRGFHEKAASVNKNLHSRDLFLGDRARGLALLRGEPPFLRRGGNPPAPAFPFRGNGKGDQKIPSLLPQAMNSVYSRFFVLPVTTAEIALLPFAL